MPLIKCPDCKHQVSTRAPTCPQCGCPIAGTSAVKKKAVKKKAVKKKAVKKKVKRKPRGAIGWNSRTGKSLADQKRPRPLYEARRSYNSDAEKSIPNDISEEEEFNPMWKLSIIIIVNLILIVSIIHGGLPESQASRQGVGWAMIFIGFLCRSAFANVTKSFIFQSIFGIGFSILTWFILIEILI